ncbi:MAG TPA: DinB family protein [Pseudonocardiaceae bacterium]|jgi:hypothetical protein|nr:DinB family protein [Pseudonocardiaceae bacterium]
MNSARDDLVETSDYVWQRLRSELVGLTDEEYRWEPVPGCRTVRPFEGGFRSDGPSPDGAPPEFTTLAWRLCHIADFLTEDRNGPWLGQPTTPMSSTGDPGTAADALAALDAAYGVWQGFLAASTEDSLAEPIGRVAGPYGSATRRSFVLHMLDELIHHGAEAALLRALWRSGGAATSF